MMPGNTRSSRSRYSSPGQAAQGGGPLEASRSSANEGSRAFMRQWLEPAVQNKPSYEEAGMVRYGVVENMQPLGSLPKGSAATRKTAPEGNGPVRKIVLKSAGARKNSAGGPEAHKGAAASRASNVPQGSSSSRPSPAIITPSPPPSSPSLSPTFSPSQRSPPPRAKSSSAMSSRKAASKATSRDSSELAPAHPDFPARHSPTMKDLDDDYQPTKVSTKRTRATRSPASRRSVTRASAGRQSIPNPSTVSESDGEPEDAAKRRRVVGKVVHEAVQNALDHHRYPSAYALRTLYDENSFDPRVMAMFEDVFLQRADADTIDQFTTLVSGRKREGARDGVARRHWARGASSEKPVPAPYGHLLKNDQGEDTPALKRKKTSHTASGSFLRSRRLGAGGKSEEPTTPTKSRGRSDSMDSDSSLSSVPSFDSPILHNTTTSLSTAAKQDGEAGRPRSQIKLKGRLSQAKQAHAEGQTRDTKGTGTGTSAGGVAGGRDDVSGAPGGGQPMAGRGKTAVAQRRKSPAATSSGASDPAPARAEAPKSKNRDGRSSSPSISDTAPTAPQHQPLGPRDAAGPDEIAPAANPGDMPGAVPLFPNLPVKTSGLRTALQSDAPNGDPKKRASRGAARARESAGRRDASVASERARSETPARRTRNAGKPGAAATPAAAGSATRSTRSAVKRVHDEVDGTASPTASTLRSNAPSEAATRASTPALPPSKRQRVGPRVKTS